MKKVFLKTYRKAIVAQSFLTKLQTDSVSRFARKKYKFEKKGNGKGKMTSE